MKNIKKVLSFAIAALVVTGSGYAMEKNSNFPNFPTFTENKPVLDASDRRREEALVSLFGL